MTAYANLSEYVNRKTGGNSGAPEFGMVHKESRVAGAAAAAPIAGRFSSLWEYEGQPAHGAAPGAVAAPDNTTNGSWKHTAPGGGRQKWLDYIWGQLTAAGTLVIYDRLLHISGLDGTVTTAQTVGGSLTRNTGGIGNQIWVEIYTQIGATGTTITASYTDQDGNSGQTSVATSIGATGLREAQRMIPLSLAAGDYGVRAVASVTLAATTGTAGNFGVTVLRPIAIIGVSQGGVGGARSFIDGAMPDISTSCLAAMFLPNAVTVPQFDFFYSAAER
jgi:hypothetical protein